MVQRSGSLPFLAALSAKRKPQRGCHGSREDIADRENMSAKGHEANSGTIVAGYMRLTAGGFHWPSKMAASAQ